MPTGWKFYVAIQIIYILFHPVDYDVDVMAGALTDILSCEEKAML